MRYLFLALLLVSGASYGSGAGVVYPDPSAAHAACMVDQAERSKGSSFTYECRYSDASGVREGKSYVGAYWLRASTGANLGYYYIAFLSCPSGYVWDGAVCVVDDTPPPPACPDGQKQVHYPHPDGHSVSICIDTADDLADGGPESCEETGRYYHESKQLPGLALCRVQCPNGSLNNICLNPGDQPVCYSDFETGDENCNIVEPDDPDIPNGCVQDNKTGFEVCISPNPGCYTVDGKEVCSGEDKVCGYKNGVFECVVHTESSCGYFNGAVVCLDPNGKLIDPNSPDHPNNGGNADGNQHNDPTDPRSPEQGGNPDNQPGRDQTLSDAVGYLRDINRTNKNILDAVKGIPGKEILDAIKNIPGGGGGGSGPGDGSTPGEGEGDETITRNYGKLETVVTDVSEKVEEAQAEYSDKLKEIKNQVRDMFSLDLSSGGTIPDRQTTLFGVEVNSSLSRFLPDMAMIPSIILAVAAIASALIIFGGRK